MLSSVHSYIEATEVYYSQMHIQGSYKGDCGLFLTIVYHFIWLRLPFWGHTWRLSYCTSRLFWCEQPKLLLFRVCNISSHENAALFGVQNPLFSWEIISFVFYWFLTCVVSHISLVSWWHFVRTGPKRHHVEKKLFAKPRNEKFWKYSYSPPCVIAKWHDGQFSLFNLFVLISHHHRYVYVMWCEYCF